MKRPAGERFDAQDGRRHVHATAHAHHDHAHDLNVSPRRLLFALLILASFTLVEALGGWYAHSIALLAEAAHMLADSASLLLAVAAIHASRQPPSSGRTYGSARFQTLAAYTNGLALVVLTLFVVVEAVRRIVHPEAVDGSIMLAVALTGGAANLGAYLVLAGARSLNERSARAHVTSDLLGSAAAVGAAVAILLAGWVLADPLLSIFVSMLILRSGWRMTREAGHVLLEGTPRTLDPVELSAGVARLPGVQGVHHLHVWSLTGDAPVVSLHVSAAPSLGDAVLQRVHDYLREEFGVSHATVQVEHSGCVEPANAACNPLATASAQQAPAREEAPHAGS
ncbi:MAG TPA: cation diffusion facilitator family transporter [Nevskiaceae bacterium]